VAKKIHAEPKSLARAASSKVKVDEPFVWPVVGAVNTAFGGDHAGIDIEGVTGDKIIASRGGTVTFAGDDGDGYGTKVIVRHAGGYETLYSHLSSISTSRGPIEQGEIVGLVGCTGSCTGDHLHFEILHNGTPTNPVALLP
jgi:murein DD-endopeptidase MepM/ murein hydrolase activator NlpD